MADQVKAIFAPKTQAVAHKDKLEQTKIRERELKEAHRNELAAAKQANAEKRQEQHTQVKEERVLHDTKRAAKDKREAAKREAHAETGQMCEHGVWRCKICYPNMTHKDHRFVATA